MIEILFSESAAGSMKYAKCAKSPSLSDVGVIFSHGDDPRKLAEVEELQRNRLENFVPMEGTARDVAWFPLNLAMGDISDPLGNKRADFLQSLVLWDGADEVGADMLRSARESLDRVLSALDRGEPLRAWVSRDPNELCGFCHLLTLLPQSAQVLIVELPDYELEDSTILVYKSWGEVDALRYGSFQSNARPLSMPERRYCIALWRKLRAENGPLRAVVNGTLCTVPLDFYDTFLLRELEQEEEVFHQARLIGKILSHQPVPFGDAFLALRMEEFIKRGLLDVVTVPEPGDIIYRRLLRKKDVHA